MMIATVQYSGWTIPLVSIGFIIVGWGASQIYNIWKTRVEKLEKGLEEVVNNYLSRFAAIQVSIAKSNEEMVQHVTKNKEEMVQHVTKSKEEITDKMHQIEMCLAAKNAAAVVIATAKDAADDLRKNRTP